MNSKLLGVRYGSVCGISMQYAERVKSWDMHERHYHNGYEFQLMIDGDRRFLINNKFYTLHAGELLVLAPYTLHCCERRKSAYITKYKLEIPVGGFEHCLTHEEREHLHNEVKTSIIPLNKDELTHMSWLMKAGSESAERKGIVSDKVSTYYSVIIAEYVKSLMAKAREVIPDGSSIRLEVIDALEYMNNNIGDCEMRVGNVAEFVHMSSSRFNDIFREATGMTFVKYMNKLRCNKVREYLTISQDSISSIAERFGFASSAHLNRVFNVEYGTSPSAFRKGYNKK